MYPEQDPVITLMMLEVMYPPPSFHFQLSTQFTAREYTHDGRSRANPDRTQVPPRRTIRYSYAAVLPPLRPATVRVDH